MNFAVSPCVIKVSGKIGKVPASNLPHTRCESANLRICGEVHAGRLEAENKGLPAGDTRNQSRSGIWETGFGREKRHMGARGVKKVRSGYDR